MIKTVLLAGATGFIGSHVLERLLEEKYKIVILKRSFSDTWRISNFLKKVKSYDLDKSLLEHVFKDNKIDCVIYSATKYVKRRETINDVEKMIEANISFPSKLCYLCVQHKVKYFINTGSFFEYKIMREPIKESRIEKKAYNFYAASKLAFGEILKFYSDNYDFNVVDFKLFSAFGERDNEKLFVFLIKSLLNNLSIELSGGEQSWNFTYVKNTAEAYTRAIASLGKICGYETFNIGSDKAYSIKEIVKKLERISDKKLKVVWGAKPYIDKEIFYVNCDNSKAKKILNWRPTFDIDSGLKRTYDYYFNLFEKKKEKS